MIYILNMDNNLLKLFELCGKYKINFIYNTNKDKKNSIIFDDKEEKRIIVNISNPHDKNLSTYINTRIIEIKDILK